MNTIKASFNLYREADASRRAHFHSFSDFALHDFKFVFDDMSQEHKGIDEEYFIHFDPDEKVLIVESRDYVGDDCKYPNEYYLAKAQWLYMDDITTGKAIMLPECRSDRFGEESDRVADSVCRIALWYMGWIMNESKYRIRRQKESQHRKYKYSREHRISTVNNKVWLFDDIVQYACDQFIEHKGTHKIECPCWEVRGHYRHYKNGHVVFIRSYKKGKQKDTAQPIGKEYIAGQRKPVLMYTEGSKS